jgi:hypothetical protein
MSATALWKVTLWYQNIWCRTWSLTNPSPYTAKVETPGFLRTVGRTWSFRGLIAEVGKEVGAVEEV